MTDYFILTVTSCFIHLLTNVILTAMLLIRIFIEINLTSASEFQLFYFESLKSIQEKSSDLDQSLQVVNPKSGLSSTSSHDLESSDTDI